MAGHGLAKASHRAIFGGQAARHQRMPYPPGGL